MEDVFFLSNPVHNIFIVLVQFTGARRVLNCELHKEKSASGLDLKCANILSEKNQS